MVARMVMKTIFLTALCMVTLVQSAPARSHWVKLRSSPSIRSTASRSIAKMHAYTARKPSLRPTLEDLESTSSPIMSQIIGGGNASFSTSKHVVYIQIISWSGDVSSCTGSIITPDLILTAAHCFQGPQHKFDVDDVLVTMGPNVNTGKVYSARFVDVHEDYNPSTLQNDVAVIWISEKLKGNFAVVDIPLPSTALVAKTLVFAAGFGRTSNNGPPSDHLLEVQLRYQSYLTCTPAWPEELTSGWSEDRIMCATDPDFPTVASQATCMGDSGGPLFQKTSGGGMQQHGITSFGADECTKLGFGGWYVNLKNYYGNLVDYVLLDFTHWKEVYRVYLH